MWLNWKGRRATALYNEHRLLGSLWREEGEVDQTSNLEEPLQGEEAAEVRLHSSTRSISLSVCYPMILLGWIAFNASLQNEMCHETWWQVPQGLCLLTGCA